MTKWLKEHPKNLNKRKAIVIGCGVGDDCEALNREGYDVIGFDISKSAIELCKNRYPNTAVNYLVTDLFNCPKEWFQAFDVVYECNTIQVLPGKYRIQARRAISGFVKQNGHALISCRSRITGKQEEDIPLPLDKIEIDGFKNEGLKEISFLAYEDTQNPRVPHFFAIYKRE